MTQNWTSSTLWVNIGREKSNHKLYLNLEENFDGPSTVKTGGLCGLFEQRPDKKKTYKIFLHFYQ